jgi:hypothetical protein
MDGRGTLKRRRLLKGTMTMRNTRKARLSRRAESARHGGVTLVEVIITLAFFVVVFLGLSGGVLQGVRASEDIRSRQTVKLQAQTYLNRLMALNFGYATDGAPGSAQLEELFDDDSELGAVTLMSLTHGSSAAGGWKFARPDFPIPGDWLVVVTQDVDESGSVAGPIETSGKLLRITISFNGQRMFSTVRTCY